MAAMMLMAIKFNNDNVIVAISWLSPLVLDLDFPL